MKIFNVIASLFIGTSFLFTTGCASIVSRSQYSVSVNSNPSGAMFTVKNKRGNEIQKGVTPATLRLSASAGFFSPAKYNIDFEKEGYLSGSTSISASLDGWYIGNLLFGGLIGWIIVDPATGAMWRLRDSAHGTLYEDPNYVLADVKIVEEPTASEPEEEKEIESKEFIANQLKQLKELKEEGILEKDEYESKRKALVEKL